MAIPLPCERFRFSTLSTPRRRGESGGCVLLPGKVFDGRLELRLQESPEGSQSPPRAEYTLGPPQSPSNSSMMTMAAVRIQMTMMAISAII